MLHKGRAVDCWANQAMNSFSEAQVKVAWHEIIQQKCAPVASAVNCHGVGSAASSCPHFQHAFPTCIFDYSCLVVICKCCSQEQALSCHRLVKLQLQARIAHIVQEIKRAPFLRDMHHLFKPLIGEVNALAHSSRFQFFFKKRQFTQGSGEPVDLYTQHTFVTSYWDPLQPRGLMSNCA